MFELHEFGVARAVDQNLHIDRSNREWRIAEETPISFVYSGQNYAVMLATPADLGDFGVGFSIAERIVGAPDEIERIDVIHGEKGSELRISISVAAAERFKIKARRRNLVGNAGCGICGLENSGTIAGPLPKVTSKPEIPRSALDIAVRMLSDFQPLNKRTRSVHCAAWASTKGVILLSREDVGRHNALDKLIGALALAGADRGGFLIMSSRCSYEIIEKCAIAGIGSVVSLSAPTAFAVRRAMEAGISIYAREGDNIVTISG